MTAAASDIERDYNLLLGMIHLLSPPLNQRPALFLEQKDALGNFVVTMMKRQGIKVYEHPRSFAAEQLDTGLPHVRLRGRAIPVERRGSATVLWSKRAIRR